jgi:hypothetical protein
VNLDIGGSQLAVTHCPLTGSSMAFDRSAVGGADPNRSGPRCSEPPGAEPGTVRGSPWFRSWKPRGPAG